MNKRIQELAKQLGPVATIGNWGRVEWADNIYPQLGDRMYAAIDLEEFAELIVEECMDLALSEQKRYAGFTHRNLSECAVTMSNFRLLMKDHFGVENERN